jgi:hypothetical protein
MAGVIIDFNKNAIGAKLKKAADKSVAPLMEQVLKDSNYFCRQDQSALIASSQIASRPAEGVLIWDTPYAKRVYYTGTPSKDVNQNASLMWFHKAQNQFGNQWQALAQKLFNKEV